MNEQQTVISEETVPCEWCEEVRVPLKGQRPCANCRERFERTGSYYRTYHSKALGFVTIPE